MLWWASADLKQKYWLNQKLTRTALPCLRTESVRPGGSVWYGCICIGSLWAFFTSKALCYNRVLIANHLDLIFDHLLAWFHLGCRKRNNGVTSAQVLGTLLPRYQTRTAGWNPSKQLQYFKNAFLSLGKGDQGTLAGCIWTSIWGKWVSTPQKQKGRCPPPSLNLYAAAKLSLQRTEGPGGGWEIPPVKTIKIQKSKASHRILEVYLRWLVSSWFLGGNVTPDRLSRYKGLALAEGQWEPSVTGAYRPPVSWTFSPWKTRTIHPWVCQLPQLIRLLNEWCGALAMASEMAGDR